MSKKVKIAIDQMLFTAGQATINLNRREYQSFLNHLDSLVWHWKSELNNRRTLRRKSPLATNN